jgi:hypothetical protein
MQFGAHAVMPALPKEPVFELIVATQALPSQSFRGIRSTTSTGRVSTSSPSGVYSSRTHRVIPRREVGGAFFGPWGRNLILGRDPATQTPIIPGFRAILRRPRSWDHWGAFGGQLPRSGVCGGQPRFRAQIDRQGKVVRLVRLVLCSVLRGEVVRKVVRRLSAITVTVQGVRRTRMFGSGLT